MFQDGSVGKIYPISSEIQPIAEAQDGTPVANGTDWLALAADICHTPLSSHPMILCSWCGFMMQMGKGPISHGICDECRKTFFPDVPTEDAQ